jgi:hypothetical protein
MSPQPANRTRAAAGEPDATEETMDELLTRPSEHERPLEREAPCRCMCRRAHGGGRQHAGVDLL